MTRTRWIVFALVAIFILGGLVIAARKERIDVSSVDAYAVVTDGDYVDHTYGNPDADVIIIEYADFQCPGCAGAAPKLREIKATYQENVLFVFRHFPITSSHPNALIAAYTAEAASLQGKFWEMHDVLFENQGAWSQIGASERTDKFREYSTLIGLNREQFEADLINERVANKVAYHRAIAGKIGVNATPTIYVNGEKLDQTAINDLIQQNGEVLKKLLDAKITEAGGTPPTSE